MKKLLAVLMIFSTYAMAGENTALPLPTTGNVTLPLAEYNRLVQLAEKSSKIYETPPPVAYALKRAELKLRVANESVTGSAQIDGEVFTEAAAKVPLTSGLTILNAHQQGKLLPLEQEGSISTAILPGLSEFSVGLDIGMPLAIEAGRASFTLPVPAAGSVRLSLAIPGDHSMVRISPGLITSRTSEKGQTTVEATLVPGQPATVWWVTGVVQVPVVKHEVRFLSDVKTLVTVNDEELRIAALCDINVVQGDPTQFILDMPAGYEITGVSGPTVETSEIENGKLIVRLSSSTPRIHEFLVSMERPLSGARADAPFLGFKDTQRETGELLIEGTGAMELTATETGGLKRMDLKEVNPYLRALARFPLQAAFRYHRQPTETPALALEWTRFPDSAVLAAVAEHAQVTTLVTVEGRTLTEIKLTIKNQAQPFLKVNLPAGATIVSAEVAGEKVKPVQGPDGNRVPLLRAGFRPTGPYEVSFVFMHSGTPFAKKGGSELSLPGMDVPISLLEWELFLPEQYKVKDFGGDAIAAYLLPPQVEAADVVSVTSVSGANFHNFIGVQENEGLDNLALFVPGVASPDKGSLTGVVIDQQGAVISGAQIKAINEATGVVATTTSDSSGSWRFNLMPPGRYKVEVSARYFKTTVLHANIVATRVSSFGPVKLSVGEANTTVEVTAEAPIIETTQSQVTNTFSGTGVGGSSGSGIGSGWTGKKDRKKQEALVDNQASANVYDLQKRVAGVLPVRIDVPHAGNSYRFARALVLDEETKVTFTYKTMAKK